ncbi:MAG: dimethyl sulfoxide reductase subunit B, partial [Dehalococcoidia bacterium]
MSRSMPLEAPQFGSEENARMQKCDLCVDRWGQGKKPVCVDGCPMWA